MIRAWPLPPLCKPRIISLFILPRSELEDFLGANITYLDPVVHLRNE